MPFQVGGLYKITKDGKTCLLIDTEGVSHHGTLGSLTYLVYVGQDDDMWYLFTEVDPVTRLDIKTHQSIDVAYVAFYFSSDIEYIDFDKAKQAVVDAEKTCAFYEIDLKAFLETSPDASELKIELHRAIDRYNAAFRVYEKAKAHYADQPPLPDTFQMKPYSGLGGIYL